MKNLIFLVFPVFLFLYTNCTNKIDENPDGNNDPSTKALPQLKDTISDKVFAEWTNRWDRKSRGYMDTSSIKYMTMPKIDLIELLGEEPESARFYIGLDSLGSNNYVPHLILTGSDDAVKGKKSNRYRKFDVTTTCPPVCEE